MKAMTRFGILVVAVLLATTACSRKEASPPALLAQGAAIPAAAPVSRAEPLREKKTAGTPNRYLAYEHSVVIVVAERQVSELFEAGLTACRQATETACAILESSLSSGRRASATLTVRAKPEGIQALIRDLSRAGQLTQQTSTAEDLGGPIEDNEKRIAMLKDYRAKLEGLLGRARHDVDDLITLHRELSEVQSQLETLSGSQAQLFRRVETELLRVSINSFQEDSFLSPVYSALSSFGRDLSQGVSIVITGIAYLFPALAVLLGLFVLFRRWRRR